MRRNVNPPRRTRGRTRSARAARRLPPASRRMCFPALSSARRRRGLAPGPMVRKRIVVGGLPMARFRSNKRAKELQRKAKHEAKEARKKERQEKALSGEGDDDIDWSQAVGISPPPGAVPDEDATDEAGDEDGEEAEK